MLPKYQTNVFPRSLYINVLPKTSAVPAVAEDSEAAEEDEDEPGGEDRPGEGEVGGQAGLGQGTHSVPASSRLQLTFSLEDDVVPNIAEVRLYVVDLAVVAVVPRVGGAELHCEGAD